MTIPKFAKRLTLGSMAYSFAVFFLSGCAISIENNAVNHPLEKVTAYLPDVRADSPRDIVSEDVVAFSFSGGGMRASAFSFGALKAIEQLQINHPRIVDDITFITSVSGGSLTAAYYGLKGKQALGDFRNRVLLRDAEVRMRFNAFAPTNFIRLLKGGLNDSTNLAHWLDDNVFKGATFADLYKRRKPDIWINATDVYNRTPFLFIPPVFNALCSDLSRFSIAEAVHASMAVPVVFAPVLLKTFPEHCTHPLPSWVDTALANPDTGNTVKATARALNNYRNAKVMNFVKLVDGGVTDNFGLSSILVGRSASNVSYGPFSKRDVIHIKRMLFLVVDAGRGPSGDWALAADGPSGFDLAVAATDTAIDAAARASYDGFRQMMAQWQKNIVDFRCTLTAKDLAEFEITFDKWDCKDVKFFTGSVSFSDLGIKRSAVLDAIPTRLVLPEKEIDAAIAAGIDATLNNPALKSYLQARDR
jgi:NTE family protein